MKSDREASGFGLDRYPAKLGKFRNACLAAKASVARSPDAAEGHLRFVMHRRTVDMADTGANLPGDLQAARRISGKDGSRQAVLAVVGNSDGVSLVLRTDNRDDRPEALLG